MAQVAKIQNNQTETTPVKAETSVESIKKINYSIKMLDNDQADANIAKIKATGATLRKLAHETACGILLHYEKHGDYTRIKPLYDAINGTMSASMRNAFIAWVDKFSSLTWDGKAFKHNKHQAKKRAATGNVGYFESAAMEQGNEFFNFERPAALPKPQNFNELLAAFIRRAESLLAQKNEGVKVTQGNREVTRKIKHEIDEKLVLELEAFAKQHDIVWQDGE